MSEALNEYITRLAQNGIMGLGVFLYPFAFAIIKLFKLAKIYEAREQLDVLMILLTLISSMVARLNGTISVF